ncbi:MAG TPA: dihydroxy-acid dehydratase [Xanthobacteraceae bacterium]|nr:dihydroxy-acid dehydratase [Xanthobacteraceae bacterium]
MARGLRSRLTKYGDEEFALFLRRGFLKAAGYSDEALDRPVVGILSTASDFNPCHGNAPQLADRIARGVRLAGGLPFAFPTISLHEAFSFPTSMLLRNLMAMDAEEMISALPLDAVVLIGGCDKTIPAELMGAISADMPAILLSVGPMLAGRHEGGRLGACTDCRRLWAAYRAGALSETDLDRAHDHLMPSAGTCMVMGTALTMACLAETLGFMLPGAATAPSVSAERMRLAESTGACAVAMARAGGPRPRDILTPAALRNASVVLQATSGSTNALIHLAAIAGRAGLTFDLAEFDRVGRDTPVLVDLKPAGAHFAEDFHAAGGVPALWRRLKDQLDLSATSVSGETLGQIVDFWPAYVDDKVIRPRERPVVEGEAIAILSGSLAPYGAALKLAAATRELTTHQGPALVFDSLDDLSARIDDPALPVTPEHVLVLRNAGPIGAPGMPEAGALPIPKKLGSRGVKDMVRISDARMSGTAFGTVVLHVAPEAAAGGPLALVQDGDVIRLDAAARRLDLLVDEAELSRRRARWSPPQKPARGYTRLYVDHVTQAGLGCDFDFLAGTRDAAE